MSINWKVHKFGGSSLENADCYRNCANIIAEHSADGPVGVVVSAMGGRPKITDLLLSAVHSAAAGNTSETYEKLVCIQQKHTDCVKELFGEGTEESETLLSAIVLALKDITDVLKAVSIMKQAPVQILELVSGFGEVWSAAILAAYLQFLGMSFGLVDAREVLCVSEQEVGLKVHWTESKIKLDAYLATECVDREHLVITGYIASTPQGVATTLKRDGSDYSASIFARLLGASSITIWTDVSGIYSADPNKVEDAIVVPRMSYAEATELAYFGAKVLHPSTMAPAIEGNIPIHIRNSFQPSDAGTEISLAPSSCAEGGSELSVCGFTTIDNLVLMNIEGTGMIGVPGIAHRLFGALKSAGVSVMFIAQASSEHSICFITGESHHLAAKAAVEEVFCSEIRQGVISRVGEVVECSILAVVGESMNNVPGVAGKFFTALGQAGINVLSIAQGCDECNISAVVRTSDACKALRAVHAAFKIEYTVV